MLGQEFNSCDVVSLALSRRLVWACAEDSTLFFLLSWVFGVE